MGVRREESLRSGKEITSEGTGEGRKEPRFSEMVRTVGAAEDANGARSGVQRMIGDCARLTQWRSVASTNAVISTATQVVRKNTYHATCY